MAKLPRNTTKLRRKKSCIILEINILPGPWLLIYVYVVCASTDLSPRLACGRSKGIRAKENHGINLRIIYNYTFLEIIEFLFYRGFPRWNDNYLLQLWREIIEYYLIQRVKIIKLNKNHYFFSLRPHICHGEVHELNFWTIRHLPLTPFLFRVWCFIIRIFIYEKVLRGWVIFLHETKIWIDRDEQWALNEQWQAQAVRIS